MAWNPKTQEVHLGQTPPEEGFEAASMGRDRADAIYHEVLEAVMKWERTVAPQR
jgi:hypothetical protein